MPSDGAAPAFESAAEAADAEAEAEAEADAEAEEAEGKELLLPFECTALGVRRPSLKAGVRGGGVGARGVVALSGTDAAVAESEAEAEAEAEAEWALDAAEEVVRAREEDTLGLVERSGALELGAALWAAEAEAEAVAEAEVGAEAAAERGEAPSSSGEPGIGIPPTAGSGRADIIPPPAPPPISEYPPLPFEGLGAAAPPTPKPVPNVA